MYVSVYKHKIITAINISNQIFISHHYTKFYNFELQVQVI